MLLSSSSVGVQLPSSTAVRYLLKIFFDQLRLEATFVSALTIYTNYYTVFIHHYRPGSRSMLCITQHSMSSPRQLPPEVCIQMGVHVHLRIVPVHIVPHRPRNEDDSPPDRLSFRQRKCRRKLVSLRFK